MARVVNPGGTTYDIYQNFCQKLTSSLPLKDEKFALHITELLPDDLKGEKHSKQAPEEAATCFLQKVIQSDLKNGNDKSFNTLLSLMETYDSTDLKDLSEQIKKQIHKTKSQTGFPAPTNVRASVLTPQSIVVTWDKSSGVTAYLISCTSPASYADNKNVVVNGGDITSYALYDLKENSPYDITVQGIIRDGTKSKHSTTISITTQKASLLAPTNVKAEALTSNSVEVKWDQSLDAIGYFISCTSPASYAGNKNAVENGGDNTSHIFKELVENTPYVITVQSLIRDGKKSPCSDKVSVKTSTPAPSSPPQNIDVTSANPATLKVSWQPPSEINCNRAITGYVIQYARVGSDDNMIVNVPDDTILAISGLFAYAEYSVTVAAVNANGTGPFSKPIVETSGEDVPSAPLSLEKVAITSTTVTLQWKPPKYPNGVITRYAIEYDGLDVDNFCSDVSDKMTGIIEGLSPNTLYVFKLKACTRVGPGPAVSLPVRTRLPAPTNVKAMVLTLNRVEVTWDQSSDVTDYLISCTSPASYAGNKSVKVNGGDTTIYTLTDLLENTRYDITVQGLTNDGRKSDPNSKVSITTQKAAPSSPPQEIEVTSADPASLKVSWKSPLKTNCNGSITGYVVQYARVGSDDNMIVNVPDDTNLAISGLFACAEYSVTVAAVNANGTGPFSKPTLKTSGEDTPSEPRVLETVSVSSTTVTLQWKPPKYPNGIITQYSIEYDGLDFAFGSDVSDKMTGIIEGLSPSTLYAFKLKAHTRVGPGPAVSLPVKTRLPAPNDVDVIPVTPNNIEVTWAQLSGVTGYLISCNSPASYAGNKSVTVNGGDITSQLLTGLVENTLYVITVQGLTRDGRKSDKSAEVSITTLKAAPSSSPQNIKVKSADPASLVLSWEPPLQTNFSEPITGYAIQYSRVGSDDMMIMNVPKGTTLTILGLVACAEYSVRMAAVNANGTGPFSKPIMQVSGEDKPSEPLLLEIDTIDSTSVTLKWMPPETCNGAITGYSIKYGENCINKFGGEVSDKMIDTVKGLSPDTVYIFELKAHTRVGAGPPFTLTVTTCASNSASYEKQKSTAPPTEVSFIPVGKPEQLQCDGKNGGSYLWKKHGFAIILPPGCADGTVNVTIEAYFPASTKEHQIVSAVFGITASIPEFIKPVTLRFPHCVNVKSEEDKKKLRFLLLHDNSYKFKNGCFEVGEAIGSVELTKFCKVCMYDCFAPFDEPLEVSDSMCIMQPSENVKGEEKKIDKSCLDLLILPKSHNKIRDWHGIYCIIWNNPTHLLYLDQEDLIKQSQEVFKRKVNFVRKTDDAIAEICLVDKAENCGIIEFVGNKKISRQKICAKITTSENDRHPGDDTVVEIFPRCYLHIYGYISSFSRIKINGICASGRESSEFNLASPTSPDFKFEVHKPNSEDSDAIEIITPSTPEQLIVEREGVTETEVTLSWKEPKPSDSSIVEYEMQYRKSGEDLFMKKENILTCQCEVIGLTAYTKYEFRVAAINSAGCGPFTDPVFQFTMQEKATIEEKIGEDKMDHLIANIIQPSLQGNFSKKYKGFLEAMEDSDDVFLGSTAEMLGGSNMVPD